MPADHHVNILILLGKFIVFFWRVKCLGNFAVKPTDNLGFQNLSLFT